MIELVLVASVVGLVGGIVLLVKADIDNGLLFGLGIAGALVSLFPMIFSGIVLIERASCNGLASRTERAVRFDVWAGCFVKLGDEWMPSDQFGDLRLRGELP